MDGPQRSATVPEEARFCPTCDGPVGRARHGRPGRERGVCPWCRAAFDLTPALGPGLRLDGRHGSYRVGEALRPGSRGWVYRAEVVRPGHDDDGAPVVLTRLEGPEGPAAGHLAVTEPEVLLDLDVPGLVAARDVADAVEPGGPSRHLVLDHVPGRHLDGDRPVDPVVALETVVAAAGPLAALHRRGLLHADVTPANLLVAASGVTVMDLGSVRRRDDRTSDVWGTTGFLAPEIAPGGAGPSVASEVYALGRTLAVLVLDFDHVRSHALRLPAPDDAPLLAAHPALARLLERATAPEPPDRHHDVTAFAEEARAVRAELASTGHHRTRRHATPAPYRGPAGRGERTGRAGRAGRVGGGAAT